MSEDGKGMSRVAAQVAERAAQRLLAAAQHLGAQDDMTAVVKLFHWGQEPAAAGAVQGAAHGAVQG